MADKLIKSPIQLGRSLQAATAKPPSRVEMLSALNSIVDLLEIRLSKERDLMQMAISVSLKELFAPIEQEHQQFLETARRTIAERVTSLKEGLVGDKGDKGEKGDRGAEGTRGKDGKDGRDGKDAKDADVESIVVKLEKDLPQFGVAFRDGLELLQGAEKLKIEAIADLPERLEELKKLRNEVKIGGYSDNHVKFALGRIEAVEEEVSFSGTTGTLTNLPVTDSVKLFRGGVRMQEGTGKDYTVSGKTVTLATAAIGGEIFVVDYIKS